MYLAGVSVRRVEDITEALWGTRISPSNVSDLNKKIYGRIDDWRNRPIKGEHPYVFLDGIWLKKSWGGEIHNVSVLIAIGVNQMGYREVLGVCEGSREDKESWSSFLRHLKERGLKGVRLVTSDKSMGLLETLPHFFPEALWQRCIVHFYRNVYSAVPKGKAREVSRQDRPGRLRGDPELLPFSLEALEAAQNQQFAGTTEPKDPSKDKGRRQLPRRGIGPDAGIRQSPACSFHQ
ncbi:transposase mutator type [Dethiosulfovibrio peptidovorans DSM 11002]|uniref:Mutator family transposase n=1 Tax=Dethiosulfovibrio peptidovorans DSM 11002 TaxID=469381 RepID=D2Z5R7_9BACT|nr:transposase mutator type [Dethiosulfovibrio peptidovorans DSM 11002]